MEVIKFQQSPLQNPPTVVTIGNFDGVHLGHQALIRKVVNDAKQRGCVSALVTFDPHPQEVLHPQKKLEKICTAQLQQRLLQENGLDAVYIIQFTKEFSQLSPENFAHKFLIEQFNLSKLVIGYDFHFGKNRAGNADFLESFSRDHFFDMEVIHPIEVHQKTVSSSLIRQLIANNRFQEIPNYLGRKYSLYAEVKKGDQRGRTIGFPTANLSFPFAIPLGYGVYVTEVQVLGRRYYGVTNVGIRPTFNKTDPTVETYIFDFSEDIYGELIEVWPLKKLREEKKFSGLKALKQQIQIDLDNAQSYLQSV